MSTVVVRTAVGAYGGGGWRSIRSAVIAEPEDDIRDLVQIVVEGLDVEVLAVGDGVAALEACREHRPDLLLVDVHVAVLSAVDVIRAVRADPALRDTHVVAMTARAMASDVEEILAAGADHYVIKPFGPIELRDLFGRGPDPDDHW